MSLIALGIYGIATLLFLIVGIIIVYHLTKFGFIGDATKFMVIIFIIISVLLVATSSIYVARTDWSSASEAANNTLQTGKPFLGY